MAEISIIVPCYNVESYLHRSLGSLMEQTFSDIEIICINDGSTDKTLKILNSYAQDDPRIKVIDQKNKGVGAARNAGLDIASGKYLMFLDPDDYFEPYACEKAYEAIERNKTDIVIFGYYDLFNGRKTDSYRANQIHKSSAGVWKCDYPLHFFIFQKIYSKAFLDEHNIKIPEGLYSAEDVLFHYLFVFMGASFSQIDENLVVYQTKRENSITTKRINLIETDIEASKTMTSTSLYQKQPIEIRKRFIKQWINSARWNYDKFSSLKIHLMLIKDMIKMQKYVESLFTKEELKDFKDYNEYKEKVRNLPKDCLRQLFNLKSNKQYSQDTETYLKEINFAKTLKKIKNKIKDKKVVIYGAGSLLSTAIQNYDFSDIVPVGISDYGFGEEKEGEICFGYKIIPLSKLKEYNFDTLIVSTKNYETIISNFKKDDFYKKIKILPLFKK